MRRLLDINTWIALTLETHPQHRAARDWYEQTAVTPGDLVFCRQTEIGFLRLLTQSAVMTRCSAMPLSNSEAAEFLSRLHADPAVSRSDEPPTAKSLWLELANVPQPAPNLWMDAYLAAFTISLGAQMVSFDRGFLSIKQRGLNLQWLQSQ